MCPANLNLRPRIVSVTLGSTLYTPELVALKYLGTSSAIPSTCECSIYRSAWLVMVHVSGPYNDSCMLMHANRINDNLFEIPANATVMGTLSTNRVRFPWLLLSVNFVRLRHYRTPADSAGIQRNPADDCGSPPRKSFCPPMSDNRLSVSEKR